MPAYISFRLHEGTPLAGGNLFGGRDINEPMTLNGSAGMDRTLLAVSESALALSIEWNGQRARPWW